MLRLEKQTISACWMCYYNLNLPKGLDMARERRNSVLDNKELSITKKPVSEASYR